MIDQNDPRLTAYLLGELDKADAEEIRKALDTSASLRAHLEGLQDTIATLENAFGGAGEAADRLTPEQLAAVATASQAPTVSLSDRPSRVWLRRLALAALVLIAVGVSFLAMKGPVLMSGVWVEPAEQTESSSVRDEASSLPAGTPSIEDVEAEAAIPLNDTLVEKLGRDRNESETLMLTPAIVIQEEEEPAIAMRAALSPVEETRPEEGVSRVERFNSGDGDRGGEADKSESATIGWHGANGQPTTDLSLGFSTERSLVDAPRGSGAGGPATSPMRVLRQQHGPQGSAALSPSDPAPRSVSDQRPRPAELPPAEPAPAEDALMVMDDVGAESNRGVANGYGVRPDFSMQADPPAIGEAATGGREVNGRGSYFMDSIDPEAPFDASAARPVSRPRVSESMMEASDLDDSMMMMEMMGGVQERQEAIAFEEIDAQPMEATRPATRTAPPAGAKIGNNRARSLFISPAQSNREAAPATEPMAVDVDDPFGAEAEASERGKRRLLSETTNEPLAEEPAPAPKTWKPASASTNRARLSIGHHDDLKLTARDTYVRIDGFRARVMFDLYYYNDRGRQLEGQFLLRLPDDASLHYFAFGPTDVTRSPRPSPARSGGKAGDDSLTEPVDVAAEMLTSLRDKTASVGSDLGRRATDHAYRAESNTVFAAVKTAYVAPKQKAALAYEETVRRRVDPALVEWSGPGIFQTKVFPLLPGKLHRIVVGYDITLQDDGNDQVFTLDLPEDEAGGRVEFDVAAVADTEAKLNPDVAPFVSGGRAYYRYESAEPRDYSVRLSGTRDVLLTHRDTLGEEYFGARVITNLPDDPAELAGGRAVILLDTSWSDRPAAFARRIELLKSLLKENRDAIREFAVMTFNVDQHWWRGEYVANDDENLTALAEFTSGLALEGATDLTGAFQAVADTDWVTPKESKPANCFLLSDAIATWGSTDFASINQAAAAHSGPVFAYALGGFPNDRIAMRSLADATNGAVFSVAEEAELPAVAIAHRSRPWRFVKATAQGADEILVQGTANTIYPGQPLIIAGTGKLTGEVTLAFQRGEQTHEVTLSPKQRVLSPAAGRLFGQLAVEQLEMIGEPVEDITISFARYFRVPGRTCSMVMLESEADYARFGVNIAPQEDQLVIASSSVETLIARHDEEEAIARASSKRRFIAWVDSLQSNSLVNVSTALRLAMEQMPDSAFGFSPEPLECRAISTDQMTQSYLDELSQTLPEFDSIMLEAEQTLIKFGADDAIKTASTLIEAKPSDVDTLRSVAFRAFQWHRGDQAVPLLWRIAVARPYQPQCLLLLGRAFVESGDLDSAAVCYELVASGNWNARWNGAKVIAKVELLQTLAKISGQESRLGGYARAREKQLRSEITDRGLDVVVIMHWNTDRTDVDLHVTEPSGEVCYYKHPQTRSGGRLTQDITEGLGPEMFSLPVAPQGEYHVQAKYYRADQNRTSAPTEALVTLIQGLAAGDESTQTQRVTLQTGQEMHTLFRFRVK